MFIIIFGFIIPILIWVAFLYGILSVIKKIYRKLKNSNNNSESLYDEYPDDVNENYDEIEKNPHAHSDFNFEGAEADGRGDEFSSSPVGTHELNLDDIMNEVSAGKDTLQERRARGVKIAEYLADKPSGDRFHKLDRIPSNKIANAKKEMSIANSDVPLAIFDDSMMGSGKVGVVISVNGMYWKNIFEAPCFIEWNKIKSLYRAGEIKFEKTKIAFGKYGNIDTKSSSYNRDDLISAVEQISQLI